MLEPVEGLHGGKFAVLADANGLARVTIPRY